MTNTDEATSLVDDAIETGAAELGIDPGEIRERMATVRLEEKPETTDVAADDD